MKDGRGTSVSRYNVGTGEMEEMMSYTQPVLDDIFAELQGPGFSDLPKAYKDKLMESLDAGLQRIEVGAHQESISAAETSMLGLNQHFDQMGRSETDFLNQGTDIDVQQQQQMASEIDALLSQFEGE